MKDGEAFELRLVSLKMALDAYKGRLSRDNVPSWVDDLTQDMEHLLEELTKGQVKLEDLVGDGGGVLSAGKTAVQWRERILAASTRNSEDTSSSGGAGLLLWLAEGDIAAIAGEAGVNVRVW